MSKRPVVVTNRQRVVESSEVDWPSGLIPDVIKYLQRLEKEHAHLDDLVITEEWTGYEDCHYEVRGSRWETDKEMEDRVRLETTIQREWDKRKYEEIEERDAIRAKEIEELEQRLQKLRGFSGEWA